MMVAISRRGAIASAFAVCLIIGLIFNLEMLGHTHLIHKINPSASIPSWASHEIAPVPRPVQQYFEQVFSPDIPSAYDFPHLKAACDRTVGETQLDDVYLQCENFFAGMTSIMNEVKVCLKMAIDSGTNLVLPIMPLRSSTDLKEFNMNNKDAYMPYDQWFDADHLIRGLKRACPRMKVVHPDQLKEGAQDSVVVKNKWELDIMRAPGYHLYTSHFWTGRPFKEFFDEEFAEFQKKAQPKEKEGISVITAPATFLLFRITDDPTRDDLRLWNDLATLIRFLDKPRSVVSQLLKQLPRPFYGVHFRVENDTIWSSLEHQLAQNLDALDKAWLLYGSGKEEEKPPVYIACGDEGQIKKFVDAGKERGWAVTHKWDVARETQTGDVLQTIDELAFDFQGAVDMGMMIQSSFFFGISGSAFSSTVAHARDPLGRYRGSALREPLIDDDGARSHIFADGAASSYACCL